MEMLLKPKLLLKRKYSKNVKNVIFNILFIEVTEVNGHTLTFFFFFFNVEYRNT